MEYILTVSVAILIGLIGERKWPKWGKFYYGTILGISVIYQLVFFPYRVFRVLHDFSHLF